MKGMFCVTTETKNGRITDIRLDQVHVNRLITLYGEWVNEGKVFVVDRVKITVTPEEGKVSASVGQ